MWFLALLQDEMFYFLFCRFRAERDVRSLCHTLTCLFVVLFQHGRSVQPVGVEDL